MNKKLVPVLVIIAILAAGGYYLRTRKPDGPMTSNQIMSEASEFAKAMVSGKPTICTMTKDDDKMEYHLKGKMMAANITTKVEGKTTLSHMINDGIYLYIWSNDQKQGTKMVIPTEDEAKAMSEKANDYQQNTPKLEGESDYQNFMDQGYTVECKSDTAGDSVFTPPSDIDFIDPSVMMEALPAQGESGKFDMSQIEELQKKYGGQIPANY